MLSPYISKHMTDHPSSHIISAIRKRRSVYPPEFIKGHISDQLISDLLALAQYAPTHRLTEPWRFAVISPAARPSFSDFVDGYYESLRDTSEYVGRKHHKALKKIEQSSHIVAIILRRDPAQRVPEWEEIAAVSMAVQNIWLAAKQFGIGLYWSTPDSRMVAGDYLGLQETETCLGYLYMGLSPKCQFADRDRLKPEDYIKWL